MIQTNGIYVYMTSLITTIWILNWIKKIGTFLFIFICWSTMRNFVFFYQLKSPPVNFVIVSWKWLHMKKKWSSVHLYHNISNNFRSCHVCTQDQSCSFCWEKDVPGNCFPVHFTEHSEPDKQHRCINNGTLCRSIDNNSTPYTWIIVTALVLFVISYSAGKLKLISILHLYKPPPSFIFYQSILHL